MTREWLQLQIEHNGRYRKAIRDHQHCFNYWFFVEDRTEERTWPIVQIMQFVLKRASRLGSLQVRSRTGSTEHPSLLRYLQLRSDRPN